ncbi:MAG: diguanylate cyclase [Acidobacteria bacterium]|nr:diguanylate cyclase [Acidobacteriota bacterium]
MEKSVVSNAYVRLVILMGAAVLLPQLTRWQSSDGLQYLSYMLLAVLAGCFHVEYRTEQGRFPLSTLFVMITMKALSTPEAFLLAAISTGAEVVNRQAENRRTVIDVAFSVASVSIAVGLADVAMRGIYLPLHMSQLNAALQAALVGATYFVGISFPEAMRESLDTGGKLVHVWKEKQFWTVPYYVAAALVASLFDVARASVGWQIPVLVLPVVFLPYRAYRLYMERVEGSLEHAEEMAALHLRTIEALALAIDAKDETTHDHLQRVQVYAMEVGKELGLSRQELEALRAASMLHDIGKLAVPEHIISKPGKLTPEEFEKMKIHPVVGAEILERGRFPYPVVPIVRSHHERWDGNGYPDRLKGEEIPIGSRVLAAVDCLDALASDRQYRKALPLDQAIGILVRDAGTAFDPRVVEILARRYVELESKAKAHHTEPLKLTKDVVIRGGDAPAAGFEKSDGKAKIGEGFNQPDFLALIAAARQEAHGLFELAQDLGSSLSLDETLSVLSVRLKRIVPFDSMAVYVKREQLLMPEFVSGENFRLFASLQIPMGEGLSGWVAENAKPIVNGNPTVEPGYLNDATKFSTLRSALAVPLHGMNGVVGVIALYHTERDAYTKDHLRVLQVVSSKLSLAIENALKYRQAETSATTDYLTQLPNARSLFLHLDAELARARREKGELTVAVCDLDNFKQINDQYGHLEGNRVLRIVATTLRNNCREYDYVARMGGDEFVVVMGRLDATNAAMRLDQVRRAVLEETRMQTGLDLTVSIGTATFPTDGADAEDLLSTADRLMYTAKQSSPARLKAQQRWEQWKDAAGRAQVQPTL